MPLYLREEARGDMPAERSLPTEIAATNARRRPAHHTHHIPPITESVQQHFARARRTSRGSEGDSARRRCRGGACGQAARHVASSFAMAGAAPRQAVLQVGAKAGATARHAMPVHAAYRHAAFIATRIRRLDDDAQPHSAAQSMSPAGQTVLQRRERCGGQICIRTGDARYQKSRCMLRMNSAKPEENRRAAFLPWRGAQREPTATADHHLR